jgi:hypothetical protein
MDVAVFANTGVLLRGIHLKLERLEQTQTTLLPELPKQTDCKFIISPYKLYHLKQIVLLKYTMPICICQISIPLKCINSETVPALH